MRPWQVICCLTLHEGLPVSNQYKYQNTVRVPQYFNMMWLVAFLFCIGKSGKTWPFQGCSHVLLFPTGLTCAKPPPIQEVDSGKVVGGQNAAPKTWKWQVIIAQMIDSISDNMNSDLLWVYFHPFRSLFSWILLVRGSLATSVEVQSLTLSTSWLLLTASSGQIPYEPLTLPTCTMLACIPAMLAQHVCVSPVPISSDPRHYRVVAGEYNLDEEEGSEQFLPVERIIVHPGWTGDLGKG